MSTLIDNDTGPLERHYSLTWTAVDDATLDSSPQEGVTFVTHRSDQKIHAAAVATALDGAVPTPSDEANPELGQSVLMLIVTTLVEYSETILNRRAERAKEMTVLSQQLTALAHEESEKQIEQVEAAARKKKSGFFGKLLAVISLIIAVIITVVTIVAAAVASPFTGGASILAAMGTVQGMMAIVGLALAGLAAVDTIANDGKITGVVIENTIGKLGQGFGKLLSALGLPDDVANILGQVVAVIAVIVVSVLVFKGAGAAQSFLSSTRNAAQSTSLVETAGQTLAAGARAADHAEDAAEAVTNSVKAAKAAESSHLIAAVDDVEAAVSSGVTGLSRKLDHLIRMTYATQVAVDTAAVIHKSTIQIINAELDYLIAQDQADLELLNALTTLIQNLLTAHKELSESEGKAYDRAMQFLAKFINVSMTNIGKPIARA